MAALSERERRFVDAYMGAAAGNATKAAELAGYRPSHARQQGSRLVTKAHIIAEMEARRAKLEQPTIADAKERRELLSEHARSKDNPMAAIKAMDVLNKMDGEYLERVKHEGGISVDVTGTAERIAGTLARIATRAQGRFTGGTQ